MPRGTSLNCFGLFHRGRQSQGPERGAATRLNDDNNNNATRDTGLQGVEFSPRTSQASSHISPSRNHQEPSPLPPQQQQQKQQRIQQQPSSSSRRQVQPTTNLQNPQLAGYYSPSVPTSAASRTGIPAAQQQQQLRGFYEPAPPAATTRWQQDGVLGRAAYG